MSKLVKNETGPAAHSGPSPAAWDAIAAGYDNYVTHTEEWLANEALGRAGLRAHHRFLDVAAGCGGLSLPAARLGAQVVATDWSPAMIERLRARARSEGLPAIDARVMDCHTLAIEDEAFDIVGSQFGVMLVADQPQALREMARVTRGGGRVLLIAYGPPADIEFLQLFTGALQAVDPGFSGLPSDPPPLEFQASDPGVLRQRLVGAGLRSVTVETVSERLAFGTGNELWDWILAGNPIPGRLIAGLSDEQRTDMRAVLDGMVRDAGGGGAAILSNPVHIGIGTR